MEQHYTSNAGYTGEINYHNWFFYENLITQLKLANSTLLNPKYHDRYISHPINILQYYQPDQEKTHLNVEIPVILQTHQQQFGSLYEDPYQTNMGKDTKNKTVTLQTFKTIENTISNFIIARFMVYKWIGPFNEMYIKMKQ